MRTKALPILLLAATICRGDDFSITHIGSGSITWDDPHGNGVYTVQWASNLGDPEWSSDWMSLQQIAATGGQITASIPMFFRVVHYPAVTNDMVLVPGGGQPLGPTHSFYMARYEVTVSQYCEFLNNAEQNPSNGRGSNMYFVSNGDVRTAESGSYLFDISDSYLIYDKDAPLGQRYSIFPPGNSDHPITGVSWYGAVKYCNWLTIEDGLGEAERCYSEGISGQNWHPVNLTDAEWQLGFEIAQRLTWINDYAGYRLPMVFSEEAGYFDEFYKAAAWNGTSNTKYCYGRETMTPSDCNYRDSGDPYEIYSIQTTPIGMYDGGTHGGFVTSSNQNQYGIFDLSGNVSEWGTGDGYGAFDFPWSGGSWNQSDSGFNGTYYYHEARWSSSGKADGGGDTYNWMGLRVVRSAP